MSLHIHGKHIENDDVVRVSILFFLQFVMLVKVKFGETQKYVKVTETEDGYDDFNTFLKKGWHHC